MCYYCVGDNMKALVVSDIHGSSYYANKIKTIIAKENPDMFIVLGDLYYHGPRNDLSLEYDPMKVASVLNSFKNIIYVVKGNCDSEVDEMISEFIFYDDLILEVNGKKMFCTHGHKFNIDRFPKQDFDIMAYGHLHVGFIKKDDNHIFINPGSISLPKNGSKNSYILIDEFGIYLKDIEGTLIENFKF